VDHRLDDGGRWFCGGCRLRMVVGIPTDIHWLGHGVRKREEIEVSRSQAVREEALKLDGYRCAICGYDGRDEQFRSWVAPHHGVAECGRKLGMGGSDEQDNVENVITLCTGLGAGGLPPNRKDFLGPNEGSCHSMVEAGKWVIERWARERTFRHGQNVQTGDPVIGCCQDAGLEVFDAERRRIPHAQLWFYRRKEAEEGERILSELSRFTLLDKTIAERVHRLGQVVKTADPDARSLRECLASRGLSASQLLSASRLYARSLETGIEWEDGVSLSDYRRLLNESGCVSKREYFYVMLPARSWLTGAKPEIFYRTAFQQELRDTMKIGERLFQINKFVYGYRAEGGKLYDPEGNNVQFIHFVP